MPEGRVLTSRRPPSAAATKQAAATTRVVAAARLAVLASLALWGTGTVGPAAPAALTLVIQTDTVLGQVSENLYGHFLEHIYHSCNGGLWGEIVWNRSFEELPPRPRSGDGEPPREEPPFPRHWQALGEGLVSRDATQALNGRVSLKIVSDLPGAGVAQANFCLRAGDTCRGSLWLRGEASNGLMVRFVDGVSQLAEQTLPRPTADWREFPLALTPSRAADHASLQIVVRGPATVWLDQVSLMPDSFRAEGGFRPDLTQAVAALHPPLIRWPGGSFVGGYRWKDGLGLQHTRLGKKGRDEFDPLSFGVDEFVAFCRKVAAEPLMVVHVGYDNQPENRARWLQETLDWVEYCNGPAFSTWGRVRAANGHSAPYHVKYWELDNEVWRLNPEQYTAIVKQFVPAMKRVDPAISIIACGSGQLGARWSGGDAAVINDCAGLVDYLSIHHYENPDRFADGPVKAERFWQALAEQIGASGNPALRLDVSEWNAQSTDWRTGLYAGGMLNAFERNPVVGMATPALWLRHISAPAWNNAFINFDQRSWFPAPNYVVMKLWREHYAPNRLAIVGNPASLNAVATKSADGRRLVFKAVNPTDQRLEVRLEFQGTFRADDAVLYTVAPDNLLSRNTLDHPDAIHVTEGELVWFGHQLRFQMPRWSVGLMAASSAPTR